MLHELKDTNNLGSSYWCLFYMVVRMRYATWVYGSDFEYRSIKKELCIFVKIYINLYHILSHVTFFLWICNGLISLKALHDIKSYITRTDVVFWC